MAHLKSQVHLAVVGGLSEAEGIAQQSQESL